MIFGQLPLLAPICYIDSIIIPQFIALRGFERCKICFDLSPGLTGLGLLSRMLFDVRELLHVPVC